MINITTDAMNALLNHNRFMLFEVRLEIDGVLTELKDCMTVDEESTVSGTSSSNDTQPYGIVTCNTATFVFDNLSGKYTLDNKDSIYYKKLIAGAKLILNYKIQLPNGTWYYFPDVVYYANSWKSSTSDSTATLTCYDTMSLYKDLEVPAFPLQRNITIYKAYELLFKLIGIPSKMYSIDNSLTDTISYFWKLGSTFQDQLCNLAKSSLTNVFSTSDGVVHVISVIKRQEPVFTLKDSDFIISTSASPTYYDTYSSCRMKYKSLKQIDRVDIYKQDNLSVQPGVTNLTNLKFSESPVVSVLAITVTGGESVSILSVDCSSESFNVTITNNTSVTQSVSLYAFGTVLKTDDDTVIANSPVASASNNILDLEIPYVISLELANVYAKKLINNYNGSYTNMSIEIRGMPILQLYDKINVSSISSNVTKEFRIKQIETSFDTGLTGTIVVSVPADTIAHKYVYVSPGMVIGI